MYRHFKLGREWEFITNYQQFVVHQTQPKINGLGGGQVVSLFALSPPI